VSPFLKDAFFIFPGWRGAEKIVATIGAVVKNEGLHVLSRADFFLAQHVLKV